MHGEEDFVLLVNIKRVLKDFTDCNQYVRSSRGRHLKETYTSFNTNFS